MATIDSLNIQISADASRATNALNNLEKKLTSLSRSLNGLNGLNITSFSQSVSHLANSMKAFDNSSKNVSFSKYANGLKKFNEVNATSIISVGNSLKQLANGMNAVSSASFNVDGLNSLVQSINRLGGVKGVSGTQNLLKIKDNLQMFIRGMNNIGSVTFQVESLSSLVTSISRLGSVNSNNATKNLPTLSAQLQNFINQLNRIGSLNFDSTNLVTLINSISRLGSKSVLNATNNIPRLATELKNLFTTLSTAPPINQNVINMTNALANLGRSGLRFNNINNQMNRGLTRTSHSMNKTRKSAKGLASAIGMFYAKWFIAIRGIKKLMQSVEQSMNYIETLNYFNASFGQVATNANLNSWKELGYESANAYYDSFAKRAEYLTQQMTGFAVSENGMLSRTGQKNFGMNPTEIMNYQAMFAQMSSSMGVSSENALKLSRALTEIGGDLASVKNLEFGETYKKLASGLVGMSRTMDIFGINIRNANLQLKLNSLGIEANVQNLSQADKALLRTIIILDDSKFAWTDLARTLEQPANQFRLLKSNVNNLSRSVGNIFLPIIAKTIPYINGFVIALSRLADYIVKLLGFEGFEWGGIGGADSDILSNLLDDADGLSDTLDGASDSAKKLKNELMGFDEINKLSDKSDDDSLSNGIDGLTSGLLDAAFDEALERYQREWDKAFDNMENKANNVADNIVNAFKGKTPYEVGAYISTNLRDELNSIDWDRTNKGITKVTKSMAEFLNGLIRIDTFHSVGSTFSKSINSVIGGFKTFSDTFDYANFGSSLAAGINGFFEGFDAKKFAQTLNSFVDGLEDLIASFLKELSWSDILDKAGDILGDLELDTIAVIIGAFALKGFMPGALSGLSSSIGSSVLAFFKAHPIILASVGTYVIIKKRLDKVFDDYDLEDIKQAYYDVNKDRFGDNAFSKTIADIGFSLGTLIEKPKEVGKAFKEMYKDMESGDFEFNLFNKKIFGKNSATSNTISGFSVGMTKFFQNPKKANKEANEFWENEWENIIEWMHYGSKGKPLSKYENVTFDPLEDFLNNLENYKKLFKNSLKPDKELEKISKDSGTRLAEWHQKGWNNIDELFKTQTKNTLYSMRLINKPVSEETGSVFSEYLNKGFSKVKSYLVDTLKNGSDESKYKNIPLFEKLGIDMSNSTNRGYSWIESLMPKTTKSALDKILEENQEKSQSIGSILKDKFIAPFLDLPFASKVRSALEKIKGENSQESESTGTTLKERLVKGFSGINFSDKISNALNSTLKNNENSFSNYGIGLGQSLSIGISKGFEDNQNGILSIISKFFEGLKIEPVGASFGTKNSFDFGLRVNKYATGGFPEDGFFFANHNELVGKFSNGKTAVANNDQITQGIEEAAYRGMSKALSDYSNRGGQDVTIKVEGDPSGMFRVMQNQANDYTIRTGQPAFPI